MFSALAIPDHLDRFVERVTSDKRRYDLHAALIPDLKAIHKWLPENRGAAGILPATGPLPRGMRGDR